MADLIWITLICAALSGWVTGYRYENNHPSKGDDLRWPDTSMKFSWVWKEIDQDEVFQIRGTTYFSRNGIYRFDAFDEDSLYVYPFDGIAYYFFPATEFSSGQLEKIRKCYMIKFEPIYELPSPLPSPYGYKYHSTTDEGYLDYYNDDYDKHILVNDSGPISFPKYADYGGEQVYYHSNFSFEEEYSWFKNQSFSDCSILEKNDYDVIQDYAAFVVLAPEVIAERFNTKKKRSGQYRTGGGRSRMLARNLFYDYLKREFPFSEEEYTRMVEHLPPSFDWRHKGAVTPVKNQRQCGSCWAFGAIAALEGAFYLKHGKLVNMSEQALIDCGWAGGNMGCFGGNYYGSYHFIHKMGGIPRSEHYTPYREINGYCSIDDSDKPSFVASIKGYYGIPSNHDALKVALVNLGPILVSIDGHALDGYDGEGIINNCGYSLLDHNVLLVGYGETEDWEPYWILKNSWGQLWGEEGYFRMSARPDLSCGGILDEATFPIVE